MTNNTSHYEKLKENPDALIGILNEKDRQIQILETHLINLKRGVFFGSKSERLTNVSDNQIPLLPIKEVTAPVTEAPAPVKAHTRAARVKRDLSKLPHFRVEHPISTPQCSCCGEEMRKIGEDIVRELESLPARLFVNEHVHPRFACSTCKDKVVQPPLPCSVKPLSRCIVGPGLLSQIYVSKYVDHVPLYRQEQIFVRQGFEIPRRNMCGWMELADERYLRRLWEALKREMFKESYLQGDETTFKVQDGVTKGECHKGYLWGTYAPEKKLVLFEYAKSRAGSVAKDIYKDFTGTLQTDAYAGYNPVVLPDKVVRIACLAHVRRKFIECEKICSKEATTVLQIIGELYRLENKWKALDPPGRLKQREEFSKPVMLKLETYLRALRERTLPRSPLMEAINYTLNQWDSIEGILSDGRYQLDNNPIEREMRPIAIGRKNYLFAGSHEGARRAAVIYSLLGTAKLHKVNPYEWLKNVFQVMQDYPVNRIHELLPHNWGKTSRS